LPINLDMALFDEILQVAAREFASRLGQKPVQALTMHAGINMHLPAFDRGIQVVLRRPVPIIFALCHLGWP
jgi:hypothetical protein